MNTCLTCKWWIPPGFIREPEIGAHDTRGTCQLTVVMAQQPLHPESLAHATGDDGWNAVLNTAPGFGCNQWAKDEADA